MRTQTQVDASALSKIDAVPAKHGDERPVPTRFRAYVDGDEALGVGDLPFVRAMAHSRMAVCLSDPRQKDCPIVFVNQAFLDLTGYAPEEVLGRNCRFLQGEETSEEAIGAIRAAIRDDRVAVVELRNYRKDGTTFWNSLHIGPLYDEEGKLAFYFGNQWDVSEAVEARESARHARAMTRELAHRMKNMFSVIGAIVNITGRAQGLARVTGTINARIQALGRAYEPTLDEANFGTIGVGQAVRSVLAPYNAIGGRIAFVGERVRADPNIVSVLGIILHELATNALKYGALGKNPGKVAVSWREERAAGEPNQLVVEWSETTGRPIERPVPTEERTDGGGTGIGIMRTLLAHAEGTIEHEWHEGGLSVVVTLPNGRGA